jgi:hypothetical protein
MSKPSVKRKTTWREFEDGIYNILYYQYRQPEYEVRRNIRTLRGRYSGVLRQIDIGVYKLKHPDRPYIVVECKFYKRKLHVKDVDAYIGMLDDIGAEEGILVSLKGFAKGAKGRAQSASLNLVTLSLEETERVNWREIARQVFPYDEAFHKQMGDSLYALDTSDDMDVYSEKLEELHFEEWDAVLDIYIRDNRERCVEALVAIAEHHPDDAWRFNAIRILQEWDAVDVELRARLLETEWDLEIIELLEGSKGEYV